MSQSGGSRKAGSRAFQKVMQQMASTEPLAGPVHPATPASNNFSRMARTELQTAMAEAAEARANADRVVAEVSESRIADILSGRLAIFLSADRIEDEVGTDRVYSNQVGDAGEDETGASFEALKADIQARGQIVPIRVRPRDASWRPSIGSIDSIREQHFILQSGRRRLAACRELGIDPLCSIVFQGEDNLRLQDLFERYKENALRKDLSTMEKIFAIGLIATEMGEENQRAIAETLKVSPAMVNRGMMMHRYLPDLEKVLDFRTATRNDFDRALASLRSGSGEQPRPRKGTPKPIPLPFRQKSLPRGVVRMAHGRDGQVSVKIDLLSASAEDLDTLTDAITHALKA